MTLFEQLKQRRLVRILVSYIAAGWVAVSVVDQFVDRAILPDRAYQIALAWYLAGACAALVVGWYHGEKGRQRVSVMEMALLAGCLAIGVGLSVRIGTGVNQGALGVGAAESGLDPYKIAVLYLDDVSGDGRLSHVADGLTEALIDELAAVPALDVLSKNGALQFKLLGLSQDSVAHSVGAGTIVTGSVDPTASDRIRVNVAISDGASGAEFGRGSFERPADELLELQTDLGEEVARWLRSWLGEEIALRASKETENVAAWALLQRGEQARKGFERALEEDDPSAALAAVQSADSLFTAAHEMAPSWIQPQVKRAEVATRMASLSAADLDEASAWIDLGLAHTEAALGKEPGHAAALAHRGTLRYLRWRLSLEPNPTSANALLSDAESDLIRATEIDPTLADGWNVLSILRSERNDVVGAKVSALRAYEEDAFLRSAETVLWRLYATSYDLEQFEDASRYCEEGRRRFVDSREFVECRLWLGATGAESLSVDRAWALVDTLGALSPPFRRDSDLTLGAITVAGVLSQAGLADSADALLRRVRSTPEQDPTRELLAFEAVIRVQMGELEEALDLLSTYLVASPEHREGWSLTNHWWWRPLRDTEGFKDLMSEEGD